jgi:tight adherence protein B
MLLGLTVLSFLAVLGFAGALARVLLVRPPADVARRLEEITRTQSAAAPEPEMGLVRDEMLSGVPAVHRLLTRWLWSHRLDRFLEQAGWKIKPGKLVLVSGVLGLTGFLVASAMVRLSLAAFLGAVAGLVPFLLAAIRRKRRYTTFQKYFPEAIDLLGRAVRAGHAFTTGLEMISKEVPEPVAGEFRRTFEEHNFGLPLRDSLLHMAERMPLGDVRFFVTALLIQKESGGNLAELLDNLSKVIRDRFRIMGELRSRTAQGRLTAVILISLPPILLIVLGTLNHEYIAILFSDPWGLKILGAAAGLQVIGSMLLWKIVHIEI